MAYDNIRQAIQGALAARPFGPVEIQLLAIEPPRDWGVSTNVCFLLGPQAAKDTIALETEGLSKKEAKKVAQRLAREGGEWLAQHMAEELAPLAGTDALPYIARVEAEGAYVNFYYDAARLTPFVIDTINAAPDEGIGKREEGIDMGSRGLQSPDIAGSADVPTASSSADVPSVSSSADVLSASSSADVPSASELTDPDTFGHGAPTGQRIMVEYAQPNTHKDFHVGHLRNASIGQAIANLLEFEGNDVLKATYIGDVGAHVAKAIWGLENQNSPELHSEGFFNNVPNKNDSALRFYGFLYKETERYLNLQKEVAPAISAQLEHGQLAAVQNELQTWLGKWEADSPAEREIWLRSRDECVDTFNDIFNEIHISFTSDPDCWFYESTVDDTKLGQKTAEELKQLGIAEIDESEEYKGALYVDFEKQADAVRPDGTPVFRDDEKKRIRKLGKMVILRSDGTSLYQTKELGLAKYKFDLVREQFGEELDESLYVVGSEQKLYFEQVFAILRLWGFPNAENCKHISYELVILPEGKMSSREGTIVSYRELRDEAIRRADQIAREKGIGAKDETGAIDDNKVRAIARDVAIAAIKYAMLKVTGSQQIVFNFEEALSFSGRSAPYLQYAYARAGKLVDDKGAAPDFSPVTKSQQGKVGGLKSPATHVSNDLHPSEIALARLLGSFPTVCREAAARCEPATLCTYLYDLATAFSEFYRDCRVLDAPAPERQFRQALTAAFRRVLRTGFILLALPLPEEM